MPPKDTVAPPALVLSFPVESSCPGAAVSGPIALAPAGLRKIVTSVPGANDVLARLAAFAIASAGAPTLDKYWEDGPEFTGWGDVIGKYPDGTAAIVEGTFGSGWVLLAGVHPEAPAGWRRGLAFHTPVSADHAYASTLIQAALNRVSLAHY